MDFDSWRPEDTARRFALMVACSSGIFTFIALWLGLPLNFFLAAPAGAVVGAAMFFLSYPLLLAIYRR